MCLTLRKVGKRGEKTRGNEVKRERKGGKGTVDSEEKRRDDINRGREER